MPESFSIPHGDRPAANPLGSRSPVLATHGMVATSQPLASSAALRVLQDGGNAVDAAIAAAAVLAVVEPAMTSIGGDVFALVFMQSDGKPVGLNASGWSGSKATREFFAGRGWNEMPLSGIESVSVPGAIAGWFALHERYGRLTMARLLSPAIDYARNGFPVSEVIAGQWRRNADRLRVSAEAVRVFIPSAAIPSHGDTFHNPDLARSLEIIAADGGDAFYRGPIARAIVECSDRFGGVLTLPDLEEFEPEWVEPISTTYRGYEVLELGPNTQGVTALEMLNILEGFDLARFLHNSADYLHLLVEAKKLAFADRDAYIADPRRSRVDAARLASKPFAEIRRRNINPARAAAHTPPGLMEDGDTVYLTVIDGERNAVSFINSLFMGFGSGVVPEGTGMLLQNRGALFSLDPAHPNCVAPRQRPFHTLIPGMIVRDGRPYFSFGVMGGDMQPQGHVQVLLNLIDFGMNPQQAGEAPRFRHSSAGLALESGFDAGVVRDLLERGHHVIGGVDVFGGYQGILIDWDRGVLVGGSDVRKDGLAIGW